MSDDLAGASPVQRLVRRPVPERAALEKLYAAAVRAHVTGASIRYDHYAMVEARAALAQPTLDQEYVAELKRVWRDMPALAQPSVSAEPVAPIATVKVFGCYGAAQVPLDVRGVYQLDGFTTGVYVDMPSGACAPIAPTPASAERVPLTDEQIDAIPLIGVALPERFHETQALNAALRQFARAIERAHGIG
jgi:hypothetical protein